MTPRERRHAIEALIRESVQRREISDDSRQEFEAARSEGDLQTQVDIIWHVLSGNDPREATA